MKKVRIINCTAKKPLDSYARFVNEIVTVLNKDANTLIVKSEKGSLFLVLEEDVEEIQ